MLAVLCLKRIRAVSKIKKKPTDFRTIPWSFHFLGSVVPSKHPERNPGRRGGIWTAYCRTSQLFSNNWRHQTARDVESVKSWSSFRQLQNIHLERRQQDPRIPFNLCRDINFSTMFSKVLWIVESLVGYNKPTQIKDSWQYIHRSYH